jgi:uncharacterized protein with PIN domain
MNTENINYFVEQLEKAIKVQKSFEKTNQLVNKSYGLIETRESHLIKEKMNDINEQLVELIERTTQRRKDDLNVHIVDYMTNWSPNTLCKYDTYKGIYITISNYVNQSKKPLVCEECSELVNDFMKELAKAKLLQKLNDSIEYNSDQFDNVSFDEYHIEKMDISSEQLKPFLPKDEMLEETEED